jgi:hypothetical protein
MSSEEIGRVLNGKVKSCGMKFKAATEIPEKLEADFVYPNLPSKCTWDKNKKDQESPHQKIPL